MNRESDGSESARGRRSYLAALGAAASLTGCLGGGSTEPTGDSADPGADENGNGTDGDGSAIEFDEDRLESRHGIEFDRVRHAVDDLGLDPSGEVAAEEDVESALSEAGTLLAFPEGSYRFGGTVSLDAERVGVLGLGGVAFEPDFGFDGLLFDGQGETLDEVLVENVDVDIRAPATTAGIRINCRSRFHVEGVEFLGRGTNGSPGGTTSAFLLAIRDEDGRGVLRDAVAKKGSRIDGYEGGNGRIGVWVGWSNKGTVRIEGCDFREFGNNGVYGSRTPGNVEIVDCYFLNNNVCGPRIGGAGSYVENCTVEIDVDRYTGGAIDTTTEFNTRAIVVEQGVQRRGAPALPAGAEIRGCTLRALRSPRAQSVIEQSPVARSLVVRDTAIRCDVDGTPAVRRGPVGSLSYRPDRRRPPRPHWTRLRNVAIDGSAAGGAAVDLRSAPGSRVTDCEVTCRGADRDGVYLDRSPRSEVTGGTIRTDGHPIVVAVDPAASADALLCLGVETALERTGDDDGGIELTADPPLLRTLDQSAGSDGVCLGLGPGAPTLPVVGSPSDSLRFSIDALEDGTPLGRVLDRP
ncbi:right-handed parallel beta-helix repeat-containing protein [Halorubrum sp. 2020YC2]|uniref:right-handed parallel beta-helix repeat-containing protein n=1 Tax=Halorubrum sp. 2020YC2 TaxID=2836432 RepID=UPI001BE6BB85|nr:right-handed parallel beta-helix repeat-containing protein [Halorubrum sp. 2020YC2]QWC20204.1 right-handed parallel beta-helix repeat-containing protein [Halorubrum sp. 2020YC2]